MTTKISKTTTTSWCPTHPTHCLPPFLGPNFNKTSRKLPEHDVQQKILKARPHPEIFPITALRIPPLLPSRALDVQARFHSSPPRSTPPSGKVSKKHRKASHEPDSYIRETCNIYLLNRRKLRVKFRNPSSPHYPLPSPEGEGSTLVQSDRDKSSCETVL